MTVLLAFDDATVSLEGLLGDEGTPEEQELVAQLRDDGMVREWQPPPIEPPEAEVGVELMAVLAARSGGATSLDLGLLESVDVAGLEDVHDQLAYLRRCDRLTALVASLRARAVVALAGEQPSGAYLPEVHLEHELAVASTSSRHAAGRAIEQGRALATTFPRFAAVLATGEVMPGHVAVLVESTRAVTDADALAAIDAAATRRGPGKTLADFRRIVATLIARHDPAAAERTTRAREQRRVTARPLDDGLGFLGLVHDWSVVKAIHDTVTHDAKTMQAQRRAALAQETAREQAALTGAFDAEAEELATAAGQAAALTVAGLDPDDARLDACRADALAARLLAAPLGDTDDTTDSRLWSRDTGAVIEVQLVIDLQTLRGECDNPCLLDGAPLPAQLGRDLAGYAKAFRRMVTDPVDGHLLDYGTRTYLPQPLRTYVLARDGGCRAPGCGVRHPSRVQLDHAVEFPHGPSTPGNTGSLCTTCHQLKTDRRIDPTDSRADGSATWVTAWGQTVWIPPRSYLPDVEPAPPPLEAPPF